MAAWQLPQLLGSNSRKATDSGDEQGVPLVAGGAGRFLPFRAAGRGAVGLPAQTAPAVDAGPQPIFDPLVAFAAGVGDVGCIERGAVVVVGAENIVGAMATGAARRPFREPHLDHPLAVDAAEERLQVVVMAAAARLNLAFQGHGNGRLGDP